MLNTLPLDCIADSKSLFLDHNHLGSPKHIQITIEHNTNLEKLTTTTAHQRYSESIGRAIERMLRVNTRLKLLNIRCCKLHTAVATHTTPALELYLSENHELAEVIMRQWVVQLRGC